MPNQYSPKAEWSLPEDIALPDTFFTISGGATDIARAANSPMDTALTRRGSLRPPRRSPVLNRANSPSRKAAKIDPIHRSNRTFNITS